MGGKADVDVEGPALEQPASSGMLTGGIVKHGQDSKIFQQIQGLCKLKSDF